MPAIPGVELTEVIGGGGSGVVYRGRQPTLGRDVAVKVVSSPGAPEEAVDRWQREVSAMGRLSNHPNIVAVYSGGVTESGRPYLVMPYVPSGTLADRLRSQGPLTPDEAASIGIKLAGALEVAHRAGILHRDLKPANVLMSPYGEPQLADFGIARLADASTTAAGTVHATIPYAAPEVLDGTTASETADVYGLGATLHACLTGAAPFAAKEDETLVALVTRVSRKDPPSLREVGVPAVLAEVIERAMAKDPADRQPSATALRAELEEASRSLDPGATSVFAAAPTVADPAVGAGADDPLAERTAVVPVSAAAGSSAPPPHRPAPADRSANRGFWVAAGLVVAIVGAMVALAIVNDDDDQPAVAEAPTSSETTQTPEETSPTTQARTTTQAPTTTEAPTTTQAPATNAAPPASGGLAAAATAYFDALDRGDFEGAWSMTSPRFQDAQDRSSWQGFWGGFDSIDVVGDLRVNRGQQTVVVPLSLDGQREDYTLEFTDGEDGSVLVDGPVGN